VLSIKVNPSASLMTNNKGRIKEDKKSEFINELRHAFEAKTPKPWQKKSRFALIISRSDNFLLSMLVKVPSSNIHIVAPFNSLV